MEQIDILMCIRSALVGAIIAIIVLIIPNGNGIIGVLIAKGLVNSGLYTCSNKEEVCLISCTVVSVLLINTIKEVLDPALSGNEDIAAIHVSGYRWECLEVSLFQQIKELVETKIEGILYGFISTFVIINILRIDASSIPISGFVIGLLIYKVLINNQTITTRIKIQSFLYLVLVAITIKILSYFGCNEPTLICLYTFFFIPSTFQVLAKQISPENIRLYSKK